MERTVKANKRVGVKKVVRRRKRRLTTQQKIARLVIAMIFVVGTFTVINTLVSKVVLPVGKVIINELTTSVRDELMSYELKEVPTAKFDNKYFYNFIESLDIANDYDLRDLLAYVMEVNEMDSTDEYYQRSTLLVPVPNN